MILTAGAIDCHVHFICPQLVYEAVSSGEHSSLTAYMKLMLILITLPTFHHYLQASQLWLEEEQGLLMVHVQLPAHLLRSI